MNNKELQRITYVIYFLSGITILGAVSGFVITILQLLGVL